MKIVLHWVAKDVRRLWPWLTLWGVATAVPLAVGLALLQGEPALSELRRIQDILGWCAVAQAVIGYVVTLLLFQEDRAIDPRAFWPTRPIGRGRLLLAKLTFIGLLGVAAPCLLALPWWLAGGLGIGGVLSAALEWALFVPVIAVPAACVAALTDSLGRAILWSFVTAAFAAMAPMFGSALQNAGSPRAMIAGQLALLGVLTVLLAAMAVTVVLLYRHRRYGVMLAGPAGAAFAGGAAVWLLAGFYRPASEPALMRPERGDGVTVAFHDAAHTPIGQRSGTLGPQAQVSVAYAVARGASDLALVGLWSKQRWEWGATALERTSPLGGSSQAARGPLPGFTDLPDDPETEAWLAAQRAQGPDRAQRSPVGGVSRPSGGWVTAMCLVPASFADRLEREPAAFQARLWLGLERRAVANEAPAQAGGWHRRGGHRMRVADVQDRGLHVELRLVETGRSPPWWEQLAAGARGGPLFRRRGHESFLLLHPERHEAVRVSEESAKAQSVAGVRLQWRLLATNKLAWRRNDRWETRRAWLEAARLALIRSRPESVFVRDVTHPALPVRPAAAPR